MSIQVSNIVNVYEFNNEENTSDNVILNVDSHWNRESIIVLKIKLLDTDTEFNIAVAANDLEAAIKNATNTSKY
jgi:hypothetical protein